MQLVVGSLADLPIWMLAERKETRFFYSRKNRIYFLFFLFCFVFRWRENEKEEEEKRRRRRKPTVTLWPRSARQWRRSTRRSCVMEWRGKSLDGPSVVDNGFSHTQTSVSSICNAAAPFRQSPACAYFYFSRSGFYLFIYFFLTFFRGRKTERKKSTR